MRVTRDRGARFGCRARRGAAPRGHHAIGVGHRRARVRRVGGADAIDVPGIVFALRMIMFVPWAMRRSGAVAVMQRVMVDPRHEPMTPAERVIADELAHELKLLSGRAQHRPFGRTSHGHQRRAGRPGEAAVEPTGH